MEDRVYLTWTDIEELVDSICGRIITEIPNIDSIHGLPRGGLIPAVLISHRLDIPFATTVGKHTLVVDDICDTGYTFQNAPGVYTAALHYKRTAKFRPTIYAKEVGDDWIVYPWEREDSKSIADYLQEKL